MRKTIVALFVSIMAALGLTATAMPAAHAERVGTCHHAHRFANGTVRVECRHKVTHPRRIKSTSWFSKTPKRLHVKFTDGSEFDFAPCKWEDSRTCHWDARQRGNGKGRSFVNLYGKVYYLDRYVLTETSSEGGAILPPTWNATDAPLHPFKG